MKNISPHVTIYKFPITAISSIANRITGLTLTGLFVTSGTLSLCNIDPLDQYQKCNSIVKRMINYSAVTPSVYHTLGGIRHFVWDKYPSLMTNTKVSQSSYFLFGSTLIMSVAIENVLNFKINQ